MCYLCPLCQQPLTKQARSFGCENNHLFDIAKEGYVNLLPVQHKSSKDPGDNAAMMQARRAFLQQDYYLPMRDKINQLLSQYIAPDQPATLLDIGCGEGYYTQSFQRDPWQVFGLDISKAMVKAASKTYPTVQFVVASSQRLPFADQSLNAVVRIYAPCNAEELRRVIATNGIIITVTPGARHLYQLKQMIYQEVHLHDEAPENLPDFTLVATHSVSYAMQLQAGDAFRLLQMTPFAWRASEQLKQQLQQSQQQHCEADFILRVYQKNTD